MLIHFKKTHGFTLIEMAIVVSIIALMIGAMAIPLSTRIAEQRNLDTQARLAKAVDAIIGFAVLNRRLPCPDIALGLASDRDGLENTDAALGCAAGLSTVSPNTGTVPTAVANIAVSWGDLPWSTLGLSGSDNTDAWSNRLRYAVYTPLTTTTIPMPTSVGLANLNNANLRISCHNRDIGNSGVPGCPTATPYDIANNVAFVVYSHGENGFGGTGISNAAVIPFPAGYVANHDERGNSPNAEAMDVQRNQFIARTKSILSAAVDDFDDSVVWVSRNTLAAKLLAAGVWP